MKKILLVLLVFAAISGCTDSQNGEVIYMEDHIFWNLTQRNLVVYSIKDSLKLDSISIPSKSFVKRKKTVSAFSDRAVWVGDPICGSDNNGMEIVFEDGVNLKISTCDYLIWTVEDSLVYSLFT
jgi:hypothetical protein